MLRLASVAFFACASLPAVKKPVLPTDLYRIQNVTAIDVAADGSKAAYSVRSIHDEAYRTNLWLIDLTRADAKPIALTPGNRRDAMPKLSPDAKWLAFTRRDAGKEAKPQIWLMPVSVPGEARALTTLSNGVAEFIWHPSGKSLIATSNIPISKIEGAPPFGMERPSRAWNDIPATTKADADGPLSEVRAWLDKNSADDDPTLITRLNFQDEEALRREMAIASVFRIDTDSGHATPLTKSFEPHLSIRVSPDGERLLYTTVPAGDLHPDRYGSLTFTRNILVEKKLDNSNRRVVIAGNEQVFSPRYSADGNFIYAGTRSAEDRYGAQIRLARVDRSGTRLDSKWPGSVNAIEPLPGGGALISGGWAGGAPLLRETFTGSPELIVHGPVGVGELAYGGNRIVYSLISAANPNELYVREANGQTRQLTTLNSEWLADRELSVPEERWITRPDGTRVEYWIMRPTGPRVGEKIPWILDMHGGRPRCGARVSSRCGTSSN